MQINEQQICYKMAKQSSDVMREYAEHMNLTTAFGN
jgi:hypothetical protein